MLNQASGSMAKQKDLLHAVCRGVDFGQMLMESLISSYVVNTTIIFLCLRKNGACKNIQLYLKNYISRWKATMLPLSNVAHHLNPSATSENI